jgi:small subunit ribosomal protein S8
MYWDLLPKLKNAYMVKKEKVVVPFSRLDFEILKILTNAGYIKSAEKRILNKKNFIEVKLLYNNGKPALSDFKLISKPSRHIYKSYKDLKPVKQGYGLGILSTSKGIITVDEALKNKVGGEYLFEVW